MNPLIKNWSSNDSISSFFDVKLASCFMKKQQMLQTNYIQRLMIIFFFFTTKDKK